MCGICGIWNFSSNQPVDRSVLDRMTDRIVHRGPDEKGLHLEGSVGLGFRRLSIVDLAGSHQPMANEDQSVWIVFNGEIYNFMELRADLVQRHVFKTRGDTETLIHNHEERGPEGVRRLRGMFAFAIWDSRRQQMTLAVDRFGKKPLYYAIHDGRLVFGSELKVLQELAGLPWEVDPQALDEYLGSGFISAPRSIFKSVRKIPPGHHLVVERSGAIRLTRYWEPRLFPAQEWRTEPEEELVRQLREQLETAVRLRLISEVPLGAFLSGGLDSSAVVALMARQTSHRVRTFSIGFENDPNDESHYSQLMAQHCRTEHIHEVVTATQMASSAEELIEHLDEPFADDSMVPTWFVSRLARQAVTVSLSGDGGDEVFGGYTWYRKAWRQARLQSALPGPLKPLAQVVGSLLPPKYAAYFHQLKNSPVDWRRRSPYFDSSERHRLYRPDFLKGLSGWDSDHLRSEIVQSAADLPLLSQLQTLDLAGFLPADILVKVDRVSMKESLEVRSPLLDHELFEFMARVPAEMKMNSRGSKWLLQRAVADLLPPAILNRRKRGFDVPLVTWFRGPLKPLLQELRESSSLAIHHWLDPQQVRTVLHREGSGSVREATQLWALICLERWAQKRGIGRIG